MDPRLKYAVRVTVIRLAILYVVSVGGFALLKVAMKTPAEVSPWSEFFYGPGITVISCFLLFLGAIGFEQVVRARQANRESNPGA